MQLFDRELRFRRDETIFLYQKKDSKSGPPFVWPKTCFFAYSIVNFSLLFFAMLGICSFGVFTQRILLKNVAKTSEGSRKHAKNHHLVCVFDREGLFSAAF